MSKGPQFVSYFGPVLDALRELGGSARPSEVEDWIANELSLPPEILDTVLQSGGSRFKNRVHWARFYLVKAGLIDSSTRGVWRLTKRGWVTSLDMDKALDVFRKVHGRWSSTRPKEPVEPEQDLTNEDSSVAEGDYVAQTLQLLRSLPPAGFERLAQRILREYGFENVTVTGRSYDGGIDGHGLLRLNALVSFNVYFQCKRYTNPVGVSVVRDFRGAMMGRADKGIILTTAIFTNEARKEAVRDGVPPIELVDGEALVGMLAELELGLSSRKVYELEEDFFIEYGHKISEVAADEGL